MTAVMHGVLVLVLTGLCFSFPAVAGDCYDDASNNKSYENCATCFQTLANALINTGDNKYNLTKAFFPTDEVPPIEVAVAYIPFNDSNTENASVKETKWYWLMGGFYVYQPMKLFFLRSLLFSPPAWRMGSVSVYLPNQCFTNDSQMDGFFEFLTQRLKLYAMFQTATPRVDKTYIGQAVTGDNFVPSYDIYKHFDGVQLRYLIPACYILPFVIVLVLIVIIVIILVCTICRGDEGYFRSNYYNKALKALMSEVRLQANTTAVVLVCSLFTIFVSILDFLSLSLDNGTDLPSYYRPNSNPFFGITIAFAIMSALSLICGAIGFVIVCIVWTDLIARARVWVYRFRHVVIPEHVVIQNHAVVAQANAGPVAVAEYGEADGHGDADDQRVKIKIGLLVCMVLCIGSTILSLSFHFQNILIAWSTTQFYASKIAFFYGIVIFTYFLAFKYAYSVPITLKRMIKDHDKPEYYDLGIVIIFIVVTFLFVSAILFTVVLFITQLPINNSIEESVVGITTMYNSAVLLIGGLIAYNIGWFYFRNSFSVEDAVRKAMNEIKHTPFQCEDENRNAENMKWVKFTEEERLKEVMKTLIHRNTLIGNKYVPPPKHGACGCGGHGVPKIN